MQQDLSHKTAIARTKPSAPLKYLEDHGYFFHSMYRGDMLDYGCGRGFDADHYNMDKYDPHYFPELDRTKSYDIIFCTYVLNVVDEKTELKILEDVSSLLKPTGRAFFTVRRDMPRTGRVFSGYRQRYSDPNTNKFVVEKKHHHYINHCFSKHGQWVMYEMSKLPMPNEILNNLKEAVASIKENSFIPKDQSYVVSSVVGQTVTFTEPTGRNMSINLSFGMPTIRPGDVVKISGL